jgi:hypothetical protein
MHKKDLLIIAVSVALDLFSVFSLVRYINAPEFTMNSEVLGFADDPLQINLEHKEEIRLSTGKQDYVLSLKAEYAISAYLISKRRYRRGGLSDLSPWDYALIWGDVPNQLKYIKFDQIVRFCLFSYKYGSPVDPAYIATHLSNNHLIPANDNIRKALARAKRGDIVQLKGYLVNVRTISGGKEAVVWKSSMSRDDTGNGACEVLYVEQLRIGNKLYQ